MLSFNWTILPSNVQIYLRIRTDGIFAHQGLKLMVVMRQVALFSYPNCFFCMVNFVLMDASIFSSRNVQ